MVDATVRGQGCPELRTGQGDRGGCDVDPGLPVQPSDAQGSERSAAVWNDAINQALSPSLRNDDVGSAPRGARQDCEPRVLSVSGGLCPSDDGAGRHDLGSSKGSLSGLEKVEYAKLPDVSDGYRQPLEEATADDTSDGVRRQFEVLEADPNKLDAAVDLAINTVLDILEMDYLPQGHTDHLKQLSIKKDAAMGIIGAGLKADENRFRRRSNDVLAKLFKLVTHDKKLAPIIDQAPREIIADKSS